MPEVPPVPAQSATRAQTETKDTLLSIHMHTNAVRDLCKTIVMHDRPHLKAHRHPRTSTRPVSSGWTKQSSHGLLLCKVDTMSG